MTYMHRQSGKVLSTTRPYTKAARGRLPTLRASGRATSTLNVRFYMHCFRSEHKKSNLAIGNPSESQHKFMSDFLQTVENELGDRIDLHKFLTSELGAPLPLHISLSRPLSLSTAEKEEFRSRLAETMRSSGVHRFAVCPRDLAWYKSPDSDRTFLVVRVETASKAHETTGGANPELLQLLRRCNAVAERFKQPCLYQSTGAESAFHISVAWTFGLSKEDAAMKTLDLARKKHVQDARSWKIDVSAIKVKIGNVITSVDLAGKRRSQDGHFLLGE